MPYFGCLSYKQLEAFTRLPIQVLEEEKKAHDDEETWIGLWR
jgi:hypothetical protein